MAQKVASPNLFQSFVDWLVRMTDKNPVMKQLALLNGLSDEELARLGTKRKDEIHRVVGARYYT